jgi:hypothetical protein
MSGAPGSRVHAELKWLEKPCIYGAAYWPGIEPLEIVPCRS